MYILGELLGFVVVGLALWLAAAIKKAGLRSRFPIFFAYVISIVLIGIVRFATVTRPWPYFVAFWTTEVVYAVLALLALHEIFRRVFFGFYAQFLWFRLLFPSVVVLATGFVVWRGLQSPAVQSPPLLRFILLFGIVVNFMQMGLFCMFVLVAAFFRLHWRQAPLGISLGFAIAASGAVAGYWLRSEFGTKVEMLMQYIPPVAYLLGIAVWLLTFLKPEPEPSWVSIVNIEQVTEEIRQDTAAVKRFLERMK